MLTDPRDQRVAQRRYRRHRKAKSIIAQQRYEILRTLADEDKLMVEMIWPQPVAEVEVRLAFLDHQRCLECSRDAHAVIQVRCLVEFCDTAHFA